VVGGEVAIRGRLRASGTPAGLRLGLVVRGWQRSPETCCGYVDPCQCAAGPVPQFDWRPRQFVLHIKCYANNRIALVIPMKGAHRMLANSIADEQSQKIASTD
jgi:hypothetical protein